MLGMDTDNFSTVFDQKSAKSSWLCPFKIIKEELLFLNQPFARNRLVMSLNKNGNNIPSTISIYYDYQLSMTRGKFRA